MMRSIFELSPRTPSLKFTKTLRDFAFNKDGPELKAQYLGKVHEQEEVEYEDILKNDDDNLVDEELNLAGMNSNFR